MNTVAFSLSRSDIIEMTSGRVLVRLVAMSVAVSAGELISE